MISTIDWLWLSLQTVLLLWIGGREFFRVRNRNVYAIALVGASLVLVQGQAWWILAEFAKQHSVVISHLFKTISVQGARLANFYIGLSTICFFFMYAIVSGRRVSASAKAMSFKNPPAYSKLTGYSLCVWTALFAVVASNYLGGIQNMIANPGQFFGHGATMFLVLVHVGRFQLLDKIAKARIIAGLDILLFGSIMLFQLFNGRSWMLFFLFQLFLLVNYCRRELTRQVLIMGFAIFLFVAVVFGTYRQFSGIAGIDYFDIKQNYEKYLGMDNAIDWFYATSEEGFAGLAGILTSSISQGGISHDFGISNLGFWMKFIPYPIRLDPALPFTELEESISNAYPYKDSITRAGYESFYGHFGLMGVLGLGLLLGFLAGKLHQKMLNPRYNRLLIALLSAYIVLPLYGNLHFVFLFWITEIFGLVVFRTIQVGSRMIVVSTVEYKSKTGTDNRAYD